MALDIDLIKQNYKLRKNNIVADDVLNYFEKILEEAGIYGYENWEKGLVIDGPRVLKYWVTVMLMYSEKQMPEPAGGLRLKKYGCEVHFEEAVYREPVRVHGTADLKDLKTKKAKEKDFKVWVVHIQMPRRLIDNAIDDYVSLSTLEVTEDDVSLNTGGPQQNKQAQPQAANPEAGVDDSFEPSAEDFEAGAPQ